MICSKTLIAFALLLIGFPGGASATEPLVDSSVVFAEQEGVVAVEAEHFFDQKLTETRAFHLVHAQVTPSVRPDGDARHVEGASGGAYLEALPDTRRSHADKLIHGENFSDVAGQLAILSYRVHFSTPGKYYVWVRAYSSGSEDNGLHVGLDGQWPASGQRLQWCDGKNTWRWESKQRTPANHCGEEHKIFLEIKEAGEHVIHFSMREDGFEFDKWMMTMDRDLLRPSDMGPASVLKIGKLPKAFPASAGENPVSVKMSAAEFSEGKKSGYYLDQGKWLAVHPDHHKTGSAERTFPFPTGRYHLTLETVGENDGQSSYQVWIDGAETGRYTNPLSEAMFEEGATFHKTWKDVQITEGAVIKVGSSIGSSDGKEYSRARWKAVTFTAADESTQKGIKSLKQKQRQIARAGSHTKAKSNGSPTQPSSDAPLQMPRGADGDASVTVHGELKQWHKVTVDLHGPYAHEKDNTPNPFTDYRMTATFTHADGDKYVVPGYFAADGNAKNSSSESGNVWRAHFAPDKTGDWTFAISFHQGTHAAIDSSAVSKSLAPFDGVTGQMKIAATDKTGRDMRAHGRLQYVGKHYLRFAGSGKYFLKAGADAPETLLAFTDFDNTITGKPKKAPLKSWGPHVKDWKKGDPSWGDEKGKGLIGAINYLAGKGCNAFSFLTYNAGGDGDNVWPFIARNDKLHYDCSKLDQWGVVFEHGTSLGMYLHFKLQETENDDNNQRRGKGGVPTSLDGGDLGVQRKLYCREIIARFGHNLALNWNIGEENTQTTGQQKAMISYLAEVDPYDHHIVIHTYPEQQDKVYVPLIGNKSSLTGASLQNSHLHTTHPQTVKWVSKSAQAKKPWVVAFDESGSAAHAQCPDLGYRGYDGRDFTGKMTHTQHDVRKQTLWGNLMAGGAGCEYYFGYQYAENDILCQDWRSRDQSWDYCRIAVNFFHDHDIPFWEMTNADQLVGNEKHWGAGKFCFAKTNHTYLVYLPKGGSSDLDLSDASGTFELHWFNPRSGGELVSGSVGTVQGGGKVSIGKAPTDPKEDWLVVVRRK